MATQVCGVGRTLFLFFAAAVRRLSGAWLASGLVLLAPPALHAATLDPAVLPRVQAATFEVVIPKPAKDPLTYEKPLPLDQLPFQERNDKYNSVGTAFALDERHYITAGHVLELGIGSLTGEPALRDASGHVYAIDQITRFSLQQDFVEFTLKDPPQIAPLEVDTNPAMNDVVYAVGNALGTGIVIRDGLYTSQTPEDENGRWKWIRFSAAASPGNSGGPLLDKDGKVIGVVLMKSPGENLNYALPIGEVLKAPANLAVADKRQIYILDVIEDRHTGAFKMQFPLPKSFADFSAAFLKLSDENDDQLLQDLLAENASTMFPNGTGSSRVLHGGSDDSAFPGLLHRGDDGIWRVARPSPDKSPLPLNGYLAAARWGSQVLFHLRKPDDVSSRQLYGDPKLFMDLQAKTGAFKRRVGSEWIKITSLGSPIEEQTFTDAYRRNWQIKVWPLPYQNAKIIVFMLPVPDGYAGMLRMTSPLAEHGHMADLKTMTNFIYLAYQGTLEQWQDYLASPELLPAALKDAALHFGYGKDFSYRSKRLDFAYTPALQAIDKSSQLTLGMSYFGDQGKVVWDVSSIAAKADANNADGIGIIRHVAPSADLDDDYRNEWNKLLHRSHPYDGTPYSKDDTTIITTVGGAPIAADAKPDVLYQISYVAAGPHPDDAMKDKLNLLLSKLHVNEH
jgi:S1-C subfamily serine protease